MGLFPSFHLVCSTPGGSSGQLRCQRAGTTREPPSGPSAAPSSGPLTSPLSGPATCSWPPGQAESWMSCAPRIRFSVASGCPLSLPPPSLFTVHPLLLPGSLALLLGSSLLCFCLSSGHQVDKQVLSDLLPLLQGDWLPFRTYWGGWLLRAEPHHRRRPLLLLLCILGPILCPCCPENALPWSADPDLLSHHTSGPTRYALLVSSVSSWNTLSPSCGPRSLVGNSLSSPPWASAPNVQADPSASCPFLYL